MEKNDKIELRSEKVRNIIGEIPPTVVRYGILCIALMVIGLLAAISTLPWPETVNASIVALDENQAILSVLYRYVNDIKPGMKASVAFEGYNAEDFGYKEGEIVSTDTTPKMRKNGNIFTATIAIRAEKYRMKKGMAGTASILISNRTVLERMMQRLFYSK